MTTEKTNDVGWSMKQKVIESVKGPNLIKTLVIIICTAIVIKQISTCIQKQFINIPVTTYTHFDFNKTIVYPSVTFCREPAYKYDKLIEHGLYSHPRFTSLWMSFNFSKITLDELWEEITYDIQDFFVQYGLDGAMNNVDIKPYFGFVMGRCYTLSPKIQSTQASKSTGYSITLRYNTADIATSTSISPPGYHVYVHYTNEQFTEIEVYNGGLVDQHYVNVGETLEVKLKVDEYIKISNEDDPCRHEPGYSANSCTEQYVWDNVGNMAGCSGPWMTSDLPRCDNYTAMRSLIVAYMSEYLNHDVKDCPRFCRAFLYNGYVTDRQALYQWDSAGKKYGDNEFSSLEIQLYLYFNSMMVTVYEERYNYDLHVFVSDIGGSIGFLLGLSIIGLMNIMCKAWILVVQQYMSPRLKKDNNPPRSQLI